jgi:predicted nucleic acid-binding protein
MTNSVATPIVYVDANPFIYLVQGNEEDARPVKKFFDFLRTKPGSAVTSELTLAEVLPKYTVPDQRRAYLELIVWSGLFDLRPVTRLILTETAAYRRVSTVERPDGTFSMVKLPDAIHVVTAIRAQCNHLLSKDRLRLPKGMRLVRPDDEGVSLLLQELA